MDQVPVQATYYLSSVDASQGPLAEAAFLNRASSVSLNYQYTHYEGWETRTNNYRSLDFNYYVPDTVFFLGASIQQQKNSGRGDYGYGYGSYRYETDWESRWVGRLGVAPMDGLLLWSEFYEHVQVSDYWNLHAKYVKPLAGNRAFGIESSYHNVEGEQHEVHVTGDYYFSNKFSVGLGVTDYRHDDYQDKDVLLRTRYFFTDTISLDLTYTDRNYYDTWRLGATARF